MSRLYPAIQHLTDCKMSRKSFMVVDILNGSTMINDLTETISLGDDRSDKLSSRQFTRMKCPSKDALAIKHFVERNGGGAETYFRTDHLEKDSTENSVDESKELFKTNFKSRCSTSMRSSMGLLKVKKSRKARTAFTDQQLKELERSFDRQKYLAVQDRVELAAQLGLTDMQVKTWYQNRRTKWKRQTAVGLELLAEADNYAAFQRLLQQSPYWTLQTNAHTMSDVDSKQCVTQHERSLYLSRDMTYHLSNSPIESPSVMDSLFSKPSNLSDRKYDEVDYSHSGFPPNTTNGEQGTESPFITTYHTSIDHSSRGMTVPFKGKNYNDCDQTLEGQTKCTPGCESSQFHSRKETYANGTAPNSLGQSASLLWLTYMLSHADQSVRPESTSV